MKTVEIKEGDYDVKVDVASPKEAMWNRVKENIEKDIKNMEQSLEVNRAFLVTVEEKIEESKLK